MAKDAPLLEVIACSVADAVEAQHGGAGRLEIISDLSRGGLTPQFELVEQIITLVSIPVRVMLRETDGYGVASEEEVDRLCRAARKFSQLRIDGLVLGFLSFGRVDVALTEKILNCAPHLKATFHHAFEGTEASQAIRDIKKLKHVDRILTHGGVGSWPDKVQRLVSYQEQSRPEIEIIAGGDLDEEKIASLSSLTDIREFHVGRASRADGNVDGVVQAARVKRLVNASRGESGYDGERNLKQRNFPTGITGRRRSNYATASGLALL